MARLYCGACGWNYPHWKLRFYPAGVPQRKWLDYYSQRFDTVEINNSFYRLPEKSTFERWRGESPEDFIFAVKASRYLTHVKKLKEPEEPLQRILTHSEGLREKRGPLLYQFPPNWGIDLERLESFLRLLPGDVRHVFEFRNDSWQNETVWSLLGRYSAAYCIMDSPGLPLHLRTTAAFSYIRMHGSAEPGGNYTDDLLAAWARRIGDLLALGDVYIYFNNDYDGHAVWNALTLRRMVTGGQRAPTQP